MHKLVALKDTGWLRYGIMALGFIIHIILFLWLYPSFGSVVAAFMLLPLLLASWLFDIKGGLYAFLLATSVNGLLYNFFEQPFMNSILSDLPGYAGSLLVVVSVGAVSRLYSENLQTTELLTNKQQELQREINRRKEKGVLLREAHHRFKNNLSLISGMMELDLLDREDEKSKEVLRKCISRIKAVARLHDDISRSDKAGKVNLGYTIKNLAASIGGVFDEANQISLDIDTDDVMIDTREASSYCLILNELLTNSYKHAFTGEQDGTIWITLEQDDRAVRMKVKDNGVGLPDNFDLEKAVQSSLGMTMIHNLAEQMDASVRIKNAEGALFIVEKQLAGARA